jgi:NAD-reducing hydrogenase small subunit
MNKLKLATVWLDGCAGCHMSVLDVDEGILEVAQKADLVYGPLVDTTEFPEGVDVTLVEGAVSSQEDVRLLQTIRARTRVLVALGDCAVTSNVPSMRNSLPLNRLMRRVYVDAVDTAAGVPAQGLPALLLQSRPLHDFVTVDVHLPGCPPAPSVILGALGDLLEKRKPKPALVKFG